MLSPLRVSEDREWDGAEGHNGRPSCVWVSALLCLSPFPWAGIPLVSLQSHFREGAPGSACPSRDTRGQASLHRALPKGVGGPEAKCHWNQTCCFPVTFSFLQLLCSSISLMVQRFPPWLCGGVAAGALRTGCHLGVLAAPGWPGDSQQGCCPLSHPVSSHWPRVVLHWAGGSILASLTASGAEGLDGFCPTGVCPRTGSGSPCLMFRRVSPCIKFPHKHSLV